MKTSVSIPHHEYPARIRQKVEEKLQHLAHYNQRVQSIRALLERQADTHRVELVAHVGHGATLVVDSRSDGLEVALDDALDRMGRVLRRNKSKQIDLRRRSKRSGD